MTEVPPLLNCKFCEDIRHEEEDHFSTFMLQSKVRTFYFDYIQKILKKNYEMCNVKIRVFTDFDIRECAMEIERQLLETCIIRVYYQNAVSLLISDIKKQTENHTLYKKLEKFSAGRCSRGSQTTVAYKSSDTCLQNSMNNSHHKYSQTDDSTATSKYHKLLDDTFKQTSLECPSRNSSTQTDSGKQSTLVSRVEKEKCDSTTQQRESSRDEGMGFDNLPIKPEPDDSDYRGGNLENNDCSDSGSWENSEAAYLNNKSKSVRSSGGRSFQGIPRSLLSQPDSGSGIASSASSNIMKKSNTYSKSCNGQSQALQFSSSVKSEKKDNSTHYSYIATHFNSDVSNLNINDSSQTLMTPSSSRNHCQSLSVQSCSKSNITTPSINKDENNIMKNANTYISNSRDELQIVSRVMTSEKHEKDDTGSHYVDHNNLHSFETQLSQQSHSSGIVPLSVSRNQSKIAKTYNHMTLPLINERKKSEVSLLEREKLSQDSFQSVATQPCHVADNVSRQSTRDQCKLTNISNIRSCNLEAQDLHKALPLNHGNNILENSIFKETKPSQESLECLLTQKCPGADIVPPSLQGSQSKIVKMPSVPFSSSFDEQTLQISSLKRTNNCLEDSRLEDAELSQDSFDSLPTQPYPVADSVPPSLRRDMSKIVKISSTALLKSCNGEGQALRITSPLKHCNMSSENSKSENTKSSQDSFDFLPTQPYPVADNVSPSLIRDKSKIVKMSSAALLRSFNGEEQALRITSPLKRCNKPPEKSKLEKSNTSQDSFDSLLTQPCPVADNVPSSLTRDNSKIVKLSRAARLRSCSGEEQALQITSPQKHCNKPPEKSKLEKSNPSQDSFDSLLTQPCPVADNVPPSLTRDKSKIVKLSHAALLRSCNGEEQALQITSPQNHGNNCSENSRVEAARLSEDLLESLPTQPYPGSDILPPLLKKHQNKNTGNFNSPSNRENATKKQFSEYRALRPKNEDSSIELSPNIKEEKDDSFTAGSDNEDSSDNEGSSDNEDSSDVSMNADPCETEDENDSGCKSNAEDENESESSCSSSAYSGDSENESCSETDGILSVEERLMQMFEEDRQSSIEAVQHTENVEGVDGGNSVNGTEQEHKDVITDNMEVDDIDYIPSYDPAYEMKKWTEKRQRYEKLLQKRVLRISNKSILKAKVRSKFIELFGTDDGEITYTQKESMIYKKRMAPWIVRYLMPYYREKRVVTRPVFKFVAGHIGDIIMMDNWCPDEEEVKAKVYDFFTQHSIIACNADVYV